MRLRPQKSSEMYCMYYVYQIGGIIRMKLLGWLKLGWLEIVCHILA